MIKLATDEIDLKCVYMSEKRCRNVKFLIILLQKSQKRYFVFAVSVSIGLYNIPYLGLPVSDVNLHLATAAFCIAKLSDIISLLSHVHSFRRMKPETIFPISVSYKTCPKTVRYSISFDKPLKTGNFAGSSEKNCARPYML